MSERRESLETENAEADPLRFRGKLLTMEEYERTKSIVSAGVVTATCMHRKAFGTRETPTVVLEVQDQPATRESQAGLFGAAVRFVVPMKSGNTGGGKGP